MAEADVAGQSARSLFAPVGASSSALRSSASYSAGSSPPRSRRAKSSQTADGGAVLRRWFSVARCIVRSEAAMRESSDARPAEVLLHGCGPPAKSSSRSQAMLSLSEMLYRIRPASVTVPPSGGSESRIGLYVLPSNRSGPTSNGAERGMRSRAARSRAARATGTLKTLSSGSGTSPRRIVRPSGVRTATPIRARRPFSASSRRCSRSSVGRVQAAASRGGREADRADHGGVFRGGP